MSYQEDQLVRKLVHRNRQLLVSNIHTTYELLDALSQQEALSASQLCSLQSAKSREERATLLLEAVAERGQTGWTGLLWALQQSGHSMLATYLAQQEHEMAQEGGHSLADDIIHSFPSLDTALSEEEKQGLRDWVKVKMAEVSMHSLGHRNTSSIHDDRDEKNEHKDMLSRIKDREKQMSMLREEVKQLHCQVQQKDSELKLLRHQLHDMSVEHSEELKDVIKAHAASERTIDQLRQRLSAFDNSVKAINVRIGKQFGVDEQIARYNADNVRISVLDANVKRLMERILELEDSLQWRQDQWSEDRKAVLKSIQILDRGQSVSDSLQVYIGKTREGLDSLLAEFHEISNCVGVNMPPLFGGNKNGMSNKLIRMPSEGEYSDIVEKMREVRIRIEELKEENKHLRTTWRKPSTQALHNLLRQHDGLLGTSASTDSETLENGNTSFSFYSSGSRLSKPHNSLTPMGSPSPSKKLPPRSPLAEKRDITPGTILPEISNVSSVGSPSKIMPRTPERSSLFLKQMDLNKISSQKVVPGAKRK